MYFVRYITTYDLINAKQDKFDIHLEHLEIQIRSVSPVVSLFWVRLRSHG